MLPGILVQMMMWQSTEGTFILKQEKYVFSLATTVECHWRYQDSALMQSGKLRDTSLCEQATDAAS